MTVIRLTDAQRSALECSWLFDDGAIISQTERAVFDAVERVGASWRMNVTEETADAIVETLIDLANAEDASAQESTDPQMKRQAAAAARALTNLIQKVRA